MIINDYITDSFFYTRLYYDLVEENPKKRSKSILYRKENPSVLIGSFLVGIFPYGLFRGKGPSHVFFFKKPAHLKFVV